MNGQKPALSACAVGLSAVSFLAISACAISAQPTVASNNTQPAPAAPLMPDGTYAIAVRDSGLVIDDPAHSMVGGTFMEMWTRNSGANQRWKLKNLDNDVVLLTNEESNQVLEVAGGSPANSAPVDQMPFTGSASQQWHVTAVDHGYYRLDNVMTGQVLEVNSGSTRPGAQVDQFPYQGATWQQWSFVAASRSYRLTP